MPPRKTNKDTENEAPAQEAPRGNPRLRGAYQLAGVWYTKDGDPLTAPEAQQAHRARDKAEAEARRVALLGGAE